MKKKSKNNIDVAEVMVQIQEQLAALDQKLEAFITKSLTELAQTLAAQKQAAPPRPVPPSPMTRSPEPPRRPMFAVICFECGKDCEIPFKPSAGRPVYCQECFARRKAGNAPKVNNEIKLPPAPASPIKPQKAAVKAKKKAPATKKPVTKRTASKKKRK